MSHFFVRYREVVGCSYAFLPYRGFGKSFLFTGSGLRFTVAVQGFGFPVTAAGSDQLQDSVQIFWLFRLRSV